MVGLRLAEKGFDGIMCHMYLSIEWTQHNYIVYFIESRYHEHMNDPTYTRKLCLKHCKPPFGKGKKRGMVKVTLR